MSPPTSSFTCQLISVIITTLIIHHSFALSLQAHNLAFQQILPTGPNRTGLIVLLDLYLVRFFFNFSVCPVWWTKLATRQLFTGSSTLQWSAG